LSSDVTPPAALYHAEEGAAAYVRRMTEIWSSAAPVCLTDERVAAYGKYLAAGWLGLRNGHFQTAVASFELAVLAEPEAELAWYGLALAKRELESADQAMLALNQALRINPGFAAAHVMSGAMLAKSGDRPGAERAFRAAIQNAPELVNIRIQLSNLLFLSQSWDEGISYADEAAKLAPKSANVQAHLGHLLATAGRLDAAQLAFETAIAVNSNLPAARAGLANVLARQGNLPEAVKQIRIAAELPPPDAHVQSTFGHLLLLNGEPVAAREAYAKAVKLDPANAAARAGLATAFEQAGDLHAAMLVAREAVRLLPGDAQLEKKLASLLAKLGGISTFEEYQPAIFDTYSFMLDHPDSQNFETLSRQIEYVSHEFSKECYEQSKGARFSTVEDAYRDWVTTGRRQGLTYFSGKNTLLKIALKVKDEAELIEKWIEYHASIVGYHNLIIVDCGSANEQYLNVLNKYKGKLLVLSFDKYYDSLHATQANPDFYEMLSNNCKYITVLDADEFIFGYLNNTISSQNVLPILSGAEEEVYAGTWFPNITPPKTVGNAINWSQPIKFSLEAHHLKNGTNAGKSVMQSAIALEARHVGHNLHVKEVISYLRPSSFGKIGILHLSEFEPEINKSRSIKHLYAKGVIPPELPPEEVDAFLKTILENKSASGIILHYITAYFGTSRPPAEAGKYFETSMLAHNEPETNNEFSHAINSFDFNALLDSARKLQP
jgi:tetratricopeptide (TPR) repeat protein